MATITILSRSLLVLLIASALLTAHAARAETGSETIIDWSKGAVQDTQASCGMFAFKHMHDRQGYTLYVRGTVSGTCSFQADGLTFRLPSNHGATTEHTTTLYHFARFGTDVLVTWMPGY